VIGKLNNEYWRPASILNDELNTIISMKISLKGIILLVIYSQSQKWRKVRESIHLKDHDVDWRIILKWTLKIRWTRGLD
jgi:hypothetical protein